MEQSNADVYRNANAKGQANLKRPLRNANVKVNVKGFFKAMKK